MDIEREFVALSEIARGAIKAQKEMFKRPIGKPRKKIQKVLLKSTIKLNNVRGSYTNSFISILWPPIYKVVKQHYNITEAWSLLRSTYKILGDFSSIYDNLSKNVMREWFHLYKELKETYERSINFDTYFAKSAQHCSILESHPVLRDEICAILKNQRKVEQPLYAICI